MAQKVAEYGGFGIYFIEDSRYHSEGFEARKKEHESASTKAQTVKELKKKIDKMAAKEIGRIPVYYDDPSIDGKTFKKGTVTSICDPEANQVVVSYDDRGHGRHSPKWIFPITEKSTKQVARMHEIRIQIQSLQAEDESIKHSMETVKDLIDAKTKTEEEN